MTSASISESSGMVSDKQAVDEVAAAFFAAFSNRDALPDVDRLYRLFLPRAIIVNQTGSAARIYDVAGFVEPRRALLTDGRIAGFVEEESSEQTVIFQNIAQRFSRYRKSWTAGAEQCEGEGVKCLQFLRTAQGWKIASLVWEDVER